MSQLFIGLMSGTSVDAIDVVLMDFASEPGKIIATHTQPWPATIRKDILELCQPGHDEIRRLGALDIVIAQQFAKASHALLEKTGHEMTDIMAIGSHGQTIRHMPHGEPAFTLQLGDPNTLTVETGITVVADFRRRDMALGGQGAPLVPAFHAAQFRHPDCARVILNIGGIANITCLAADPQQPVLGFDTGPGNTLLNAWIHQHQEKPMDENGDWAKTGMVNQPLLTRLLKDPYFKMTPPKSTGRETFNLAWLMAQLSEALPPEDIQATLTELTATTIADAITKHANDTQEILVCGGGAHNHFLMQRLKSLSAPRTLHSTEQCGIHPDWVEAAAFAWLAKQTLDGRAGNLPSVTGAKCPAILGGIYS